MAKSLNKREQAAEQRKLDNRKAKVIELTEAAGTTVQAFDRVRLLHDQEGMSWVEAYDVVITELTQEG